MTQTPHQKQNKLTKTASSQISTPNMTGNTGNPVELLFQQIHKGQHCTNKLSVRKIYIDEDPAKEQLVPCPRCSDRNQQNMMRYLFVNLSEAIYKCEAYDCMYPFRNFKFKNFEESTVYRYELQSQHGFDSDYVDNLPTSSNSFENTIEHIGSVDFNMDFLSGEGVSEFKQPPASKESLSRAVHCSNPSTNFDTGFIDEILEDLFPSSSNPMSDVKQEQETKCDSVKTNTTDHVYSTYSPVAPCNVGRKLEKCLKVFEKPNKVNEDDVFKKPKAPENVNLVVENITPTKLRIKRTAQAKSKAHSKEGSRHKHRTANPFPLDIGSNGTLQLKQARALVKNKKLKPLDLVCKLNTMTQQITKDSAPVLCQPIGRKSPSSAKVQKMLNFIQRSMKTSDGTENRPAKTVPEAEGDVNSKNSQNVIKSHPPISFSVPVSADTFETGLCSAKLSDEANTSITIEKYSSEMPTSSASAGMEMLFQFME